MNLRNSWASLGASLLLQGCGTDAPEPPKVVDSLLVSIDAGNNCLLEAKPVDCAGVAGIIRARYPTSKPRVDLCLATQTRYEAAAEVMKSVTDAGFTVGSVDCGRTAAKS